MIYPLSNIGKFYSWWTYSLLSCLPEKWFDYFTGGKSNFDLVITHQGDSVIIMTRREKILDTVSLSGKAEIDMEKLPVEKSAMSGLSNTQMKQTENLVQDRDPPISINSTALDFDFTGEERNFDFEPLDLDLGFEAASREKPVRDSAATLFDDEDVTNVISLGLSRDDDATVFMDNEDQTIAFPEASPDEDTLIIKNDQGNLLQFDPTSSGSGEGTVLFRNDGGKIRQVAADEMESQVTDRHEKKVGMQFENLLHGGGLSAYAVVVKLLRMYQGRKSCLYLLPDSNIFNLRLTYPIEVIQNIESVLRYDLEKHIPQSKQEVRYFYALNIDAVSEKVKVEVAVIKSEEYDLLNLTLGPFIKTGLLCTTEKFFKKYGDKINFLEPRSNSGWQSNFTIRNFHLIFNWVLILIFLCTPYLIFYQGIEAVKDKSADEISRVKDLVVAFNSTSSEANFGFLLSEKISKSHRTVELLSMLSGAINSGAWLHRFSYKNHEIKIKGEAESATAVSDDLNRTGLFDSIRFVSSIIKDPKSGKETFELLLVLKSDV